MRCGWSSRFRFLAVLCALALVQEASAATLVRDSKAVAVVAHPAEPDEHEKLAVQELVKVVAKMSGASLDTVAIDADGVDAFIAKTRKAGQVPVLVGRNVRARLENPSPVKAGVKKGSKPVAKATPAEDLSRGAFILDASDEAVLIAGAEEGTYYGVIELLEQLGCRWFMPGDLGEIVPALQTVEVKTQRTVQRPSFPSRWFQMPNRDWQMRVRCGGPVFPGGHGLPAPKVKVDKATGEIDPAEHAEYFALVKGKRTIRQHCLSNPKLVEFAVNYVKEQRKLGRGPILGMGPNDGAGFCECEQCRALDSDDFDPFSNELSVTDRYIWFFNEILKQVDAEYPDTRLAFYIYHSYMRPPKRWKPDPRIMGALAPIALDRVHGFSNPIAPEKSYERWLFQEWGKLLPELYDRGYWSNLACPGFPFIIVHRLRDEIPACHTLGVKGWRVETFPNYAPQFPSMYIAGKLMWNHEADVDALLRDCYEKFFGPAADPLGKYITLMDAALRDGDFSTGCSWDMPHFYPPELRAEARKLLEEGARLAKGTEIVERRVEVITQTLDMLDAFNDMQAARTRVDFTAAKAELDKLDAAAGKLMACEPVPMLSAGRFSTYVNYMKRFFRPCTEQGYQRITGGNRLVAAANDEWQFQIDPAKAGEEIGLWRPETTGGGWQKIKTSSSSWSNQGLRYYKGLAWYRQTVDVPADADGQRIFLWCGGADELAKVWLNGQVLGNSHGAAFYPFELDATESVKPGKNTIVICVSNQIVNELGTGGIVAPVMLYAPAAGKDAKLENVRDLKPTFP